MIMTVKKGGFMAVKANPVVINNNVLISIEYIDPVTLEKVQTTKKAGVKKLDKDGLSAVKKTIASYLEDYERISKTDKSSILFCDYMLRWLDYIKDHIKKNTYRTYEMYTINHIFPYFKKKGILLANLKPSHLEKFFVDKSKEDLSPRTIKHQKAIISNALNQARRDELISANPAEVSRAPKAPRYTVKVLNPEESAEFLSEFKKTNIYIPVLVATYFGMRRSEVLGLTWDNVDFHHNKIIIAQTITQEVGGDEFNYTTKTDASRRALDMPMFVRNELLLERDKKLKTNCKFVCSYENGERMKANYLSKNFRKIADRLGYKDFRLHDLRHTAASNLLEAGHTPVEAQHWLGHSSPKTTLDIYSHITSDSSIKRMSETMDRIYTKAGSKSLGKNNIISIFDSPNSISPKKLPKVRV
jgi:integrase